MAGDLPTDPAHFQDRDRPLKMMKKATKNGRGASKVVFSLITIDFDQKKFFAKISILLKKIVISEAGLPGPDPVPATILFKNADEK